MAQALKRHFPDAMIGILIRRYTAEIVEGNQAVGQILLYDDGSRPLPFFSLVASLRDQHFDAVFHTHPRFRLALMTWIAGIPLRIGTGYRWYSFLFNRKMYEHRKDARRHELEYNLNLLKVIGCPVDDADVLPRIQVPESSLISVKKMLSLHKITDTDKIVIIHPGSGGSARDWSVANFGFLAKRLSAFPGARVIVTGGRNEENIAGEVQSAGGSGIVTIVDKLSLKELAALASLARLFIANSTGPLHLAATVGAPVIGLYPQVTPLSAERWGPYTSRKTIFTPVGKPKDCKKCLHTDRGCECMDSISVDQVYQAAIGYLLHDPQ